MNGSHAAMLDTAARVAGIGGATSAMGDQLCDRTGATIGLNPGYSTIDMVTFTLFVPKSFLDGLSFKRCTAITRCTCTVTQGLSAFIHPLTRESYPSRFANHQTSLWSLSTTGCSFW